MKKIWKKHWLLLISALLIFLPVVLVRMYGNVSLQRWKLIEVISNVLMFAVALRSLLVLLMPPYAAGSVGPGSSQPPQPEGSVGPGSSQPPQPEGSVGPGSSQPAQPEGCIKSSSGQPPQPEGSVTPDSKQPAQANGSNRWGDAFICVLVLITAISMNIYVFEYEIRPESLLPDLWCWHLPWLIYTAALLLLPSGLGRKLWDLIVELWGLGRKLVELVLSILAWLKDIAGQLGSILSGLVDTIKNSNKKIQIAVFFGIVFLAADIGCQIYNRGAAVVFSDMDILWESVLRSTKIIVMLSFLLCIFPLAIQEIKDAIRKRGIKIALAATAFIILVALSGFLPSVVETIAMIIMLPVMLVFTLYLVINGIRKIRNAPAGREGAAAAYPGSKDLMVVLVAYVGAPLIFICIVTAFTSGGKQIITSSESPNFSTWMSFMAEAMGVAKSLLELFSI